MTGNNRLLVLQPRDLRLLEELLTMRVVDREQAKLVAGFGSTTRANTRLLALCRADLLRRCFLGTLLGGAKAVYMLSPKGARVVGAEVRSFRRRRDEVVIADFFIQHQLHINELYCELKHRPIPCPGVTFRSWTSFRESLTKEIRLIPDGYVELETPQGTLASFVEVDLGNESLTVWREKVDKYLQLAVSGECLRRFGQQRFRVLVIAHSERRLQSIRAAVAQVTDKIFWFASLELLNRDGFFASHWLRSKDAVRQPFIKADTNL
jgi:hypothetical protein